MLEDMLKFWFGVLAVKGNRFKVRVSNEIHNLLLLVLCLIVA